MTAQLLMDDAMIDLGPVALGRPTPAREGATFDGYSVIFFISPAGKWIRCAVSLAALEYLAKDRRRDRTRVLANFALHQERIKRIAEALFLRRPESVSETLWIWENDAEDDGVDPLEAFAAQSPAADDIAPSALAKLSADGPMATAMLQAPTATPVTADTAQTTPAPAAG